MSASSPSTARLPGGPSASSVPSCHARSDPSTWMRTDLVATAAPSYRLPDPK